MALISESLNNASARVRFYRIAFGMASDGQQVGIGEISAILSGLRHGGRIAFHWQAGEGCARVELRMVFLALMCLEAMLPHGGEVAIKKQDGRWHLRGAGQKIVTNAAIWPAPSGDENIGAHQVQFALLPAALNASGRSLDLRHDDGAIELVF
ncbi:MAG: histidine phosphotransferase family protein [Thalassovita sp.]|nr:histidine phosphotransferase family protein [Thalassovita sp.]